MLVAVFGDAHAHAEALEAVVEAAQGSGAEQLWSLGDMVGRGPDPERAVRLTRERCAVALAGNHDHGATGAAELSRYGDPGSPGVRSLELARERLDPDDVGWLRSRKPAARRGGVQCWHGSPRNAVHEYVGAGNAGACLLVQRAALGLVGHTHVPAAWQQAPGGRARAVRLRPGVPLDVSAGRWLLNPGAVGAPVPSRPAWWDALDEQAADGAWWLLLDLAAATATWRRAPYDPRPARARAVALGLDETAGGAALRSFPRHAGHRHGEAHVSGDEQDRPYAGPGRETTRRDALPDDHGDVKEFVEHVDEEQPEEHLETRIDKSLEDRADRPGE